MALKRLGAIVSGGAIGTADILFTAPGPTVVSSVEIVNTSGSAQTYTVAISTGTSLPAVLGKRTGVVSIAAGDTHVLPSATMDLTNKYLLCSASAVTVAFNAYGDDGS